MSAKWYDAGMSRGGISGNTAKPSNARPSSDEEGVAPDGVAGGRPPVEHDEHDHRHDQVGRRVADAAQAHEPREPDREVVDGLLDVDMEEALHRDDLLGVVERDHGRPGREVAERPVQRVEPGDRGDLGDAAQGYARSPRIASPP